MEAAATDQLANRENNNFNLLRLLAAIGVIITHSYGLLGLRENDALVRISHGLTSFSRLGVYIFFIISGFLVARSLEHSASLKSFFFKRALRIFPALIVVILLAAFVLGPIFTEQTLSSYFSSSSTYRYFGGISLYLRSDRLPGVFIDNPYPKAINGSLWTLPYEWTCYMLLAGLVPLIKGKKLIAIGGVAIGTMILRTLIGRWQFLLTIPIINLDTRQLLLYTFIFLLGALLSQAGKRVKYSFKITALAIVALWLVTFYNIKIATYLLLLILPYIIIYCASVKLPNWLQKLSNRADFSYGMYIYAFPITQILIHYYKNFTPNTLALTVILLTAPLAAASWFLVEKPVLKFKKYAS